MGDDCGGAREGRRVRRDAASRCLAGTGEPDSRSMEQTFAHKFMRSSRREIIGFAVSLAAVGAVALITWLIYHHVSEITGAMAMLMIVLMVATYFGMRPAILVSVLGALYLNYFFVPPVFKITFQLGETVDVVSLVAYLFTSISVGKLSSHAQQRAAEAEKSRAKSDRLYAELKAAFERTSELEAVRRSARMKAALLDAVTHDLRTPLTSIKAAATTLVKDDDAGAQLPAAVRRELLDVVVEESDRLNRFVDSMLHTAKLQAGGVDRSQLPATAEEVVAAAMKSAEAALRQHHVHRQFAGDSATSIPSAHTISHVLYSLLENAAKYSPAGSTITLTVNLDDNQAEFQVSDEGPGIAAEDRERIFERFFRRVPPVLTAAPPGLGMGLAIARGLVQGAGGRIWVDPNFRSGARIVFSVPLTAAEAPQP